MEGLDASCELLVNNCWDLWQPCLFNRATSWYWKWLWIKTCHTHTIMLMQAVTTRQDRQTGVFTGGCYATIFSAMFGNHYFSQPNMLIHLTQTYSHRATSGSSSQVHGGNAIQQCCRVAVLSAVNVAGSKSVELWWLQAIVLRCVILQQSHSIWPFCCLTLETDLVTIWTDSVLLFWICHANTLSACACCCLVKVYPHRTAWKHWVELTETLTKMAKIAQDTTGLFIYAQLNMN